MTKAHVKRAAPGKGTGVIHISSLFGDAGGVRRVRRALLERPEAFNPGMRAELERYLNDPLKAASQDIGQLLEQRAPMRTGRKPGSTGKKAELVRAHVRALHAEHPRLPLERLYDKCDPEIIGSMAQSTFEKHAREVIPHFQRRK